MICDFFETVHNVFLKVYIIKCKRLSLLFKNPKVTNSELLFLVLFCLFKVCVSAEDSKVYVLVLHIQYKEL